MVSLSPITLAILLIAQPSAGLTSEVEELLLGHVVDVHDLLGNEDRRAIGEATGDPSLVMRFHEGLDIGALTLARADRVQLTGGQDDDAARPAREHMSAAGTGAGMSVQYNSGTAGHRAVPMFVLPGEHPRELWFPALFAVLIALFGAMGYAARIHLLRHGNHQTSSRDDERTGRRSGASRIVHDRAEARHDKHLVDGRLPDDIGHDDGSTGRDVVDCGENATDRGVPISQDAAGAGIPSIPLPQPVERLVVGDHLASSTGVGLLQVIELVHLHDRSVYLENEEEQSAHFTIAHPIHRAAPVHEGDGQSEMDSPHRPIPATGPPAPGDVPTDAGDSPAVLLVGDDAQFRADVGSRLGKRYRTYQATSGVKALEVAGELLPDVIITELLMPGMKGDELCRRLRADEHLDHIPIIVLAARTGTSALVEGLAAGADGYIEKPFHIDVLLARVDQLIASRRSLRQRFSRSIAINQLEATIDSGDESFVRQIIELIEEHLEDGQFHVDALADEVGMSPRQFRRRVRKATGESPGALLRRYRLEWAASLLRARAGTVSEVCYRVGYATPSAFSVQFKKRFGVCPSDYAAAAPVGSVSRVE